MDKSKFRFLIGRFLDTLSFGDHLTSRKYYSIRDCEIDSAAQEATRGGDLVVLAALSPVLARSINAQKLVRELSAEGFRVFVLTRDSKRTFSGAEMTIHWTHSGRDFFALKCAWINRIEFFRTTEKVLFLNDSIKWSRGAISNLMKFHNSAKYVLLPTESFQVRQHAQPYFFMIPANFDNRVIRKILAPARNWRFKRSAVRWGEFNFLHNIKESKINYSFLLDHLQFHKVTNTRCNNSKFFGCRQNPTFEASTYLWKSYGFKKIESTST